MIERRVLEVQRERKGGEITILGSGKNKLTM